MLLAKGISKYYYTGRVRLQVLKNVSIAVDKGQIAAIVGPSGAGKSTLLHILGGLDEPTDGEVIFEGRPMQGLPERALSQARNSSIGFVFQFYHLLAEFNVLENVMMPALIRPRAGSQAKEARAEELLRLVGLEQRMKHFPSQLSGGEQQRVAIARALINGPELLLCDEPTGNLDSENGSQVCRLLLELNREKGMTILMVTHNLDVARIASKVYNIRDGILQPQDPALLKKGG